MCWRFILWTVNITTLPVRALAALHRVKSLDRLLRETRSDLDDLAWDNERLEAQLQMAKKEHKLMGSLLAEIEEDHDKAIMRIELLEEEVRQLKEENFRLRELQIKGLWDPSSKSYAGEEQSTVTHSRHLQKSSKMESANLLEDLLIQNKTRGNQKRTETGLNPTGLVDPLTPLVFSGNVDTDLALDQRREVALSQSLFSALLSLLVGAIIWEAKDPCMPLVMALFSVVGLSLRSVVQFFSTIKNRPASDAVALLSFNWFILGTLTYPTLPRIARMLSPLAATMLDRALSLVGLGSY